MKKIQLCPDATSGGTPSKETQQQTIDRLNAYIAELEADNAKLKAKVDQYESDERQQAADEKIIIEKMTHGLSRAQAMNVIQRQRNFDAAKEKSKAQPAAPKPGEGGSPKSKAKSN